MHKDIVPQLILNGHSKEEIKDKSLEEIQAMFDEQTRKRIRDFPYLLHEAGLVEIDELSNEAQVVTSLKEYWARIMAYWERISENKNDLEQVYIVIGDMVQDYSCEDILDFFAHVSSGNFFKSLEGMLAIKWREYQEILLDEIEEYYKDLPAEELQRQMEHYVSIRSKVPRLKFVVKNLQKNANCLVNMAHLKEKIIGEFFSEDDQKEEWN